MRTVGGPPASPSGPASSAQPRLRAIPGRPPSVLSPTGPTELTACAPPLASNRLIRPTHRRHYTAGRSAVPGRAAGPRRVDRAPSGSSSTSGQRCASPSACRLVQPAPAGSWRAGGRGAQQAPGTGDEHPREGSTRKASCVRLVCLRSEPLASYSAESALTSQFALQPQRDSNPCRHLERVVS